MNLSASIECPVTFEMNFLSYRPLLPLKVGIPLGAEMPAPVKIKILSCSIIRVAISPSEALSVARYLYWVPDFFLNRLFVLLKRIFHSAWEWIGNLDGQLIHDIFKALFNLINVVISLFNVFESVFDTQKGRINILEGLARVKWKANLFGSLLTFSDRLH